MLHPVSGRLRRTRHGGLDIEVKVARDLKEFEGQIKSGYIQVRMCDGLQSHILLARSCKY